MLVSLLAVVSFAADTDVIVPHNVRNVNFRDGVRGELVYEQGSFFVFEDAKKVQVQEFNLNGLARGITSDLLQHYETTRNVLFDVKKNGDAFEIYTRLLLLGGMQRNGNSGWTPQSGFRGGSNNNGNSVFPIGNSGLGVSVGNTAVGVSGNQGGFNFSIGTTPDSAARRLQEQSQDRSRYH